MHHIVHKVYQARVHDLECVYDGDTINHVEFKLPIVVNNPPKAVYGEVFPDIFWQADGVWVRDNVRLNGIDCAERHAHTHYANGDERPEDEVAREKALAMEARKAVQDLLESVNLQFQIANLQLGKWAGRVVADVFINHGDPHKEVNISQYLLEKGLAVKYGGRTKVKIWGKK